MFENLKWCDLLTRKGIVLLTQKGNVLDSSIWVLTRPFETGCGWWDHLFDSLMFRICWDLRASRHGVCLHYGTAYSRKIFYACRCVQGAADTWILVLCWWLIHSPILKPKCSLQMYTCYIFCYLVSHPYAGSLGCARNEWIFVRIV